VNKPSSIRSSERKFQQILSLKTTMFLLLGIFLHKLQCIFS